MDAVPVMPRETEWTVDDLDAIPDDGLRYELVDGVLLVSPAPVPRHQRAIGRIFLALTASAPPGVEVFVAPVDFRPTRRRSVQPDVLVVANDDVGEKNVTRPPLLVVEVLSPGSRSVDRLLKREVYETAGVPDYWLVDPAEPSVTVLRAVDGEYGEAGRSVGEEPLVLGAPWQLTLVPADLVRPPA